VLKKSIVSIIVALNPSNTKYADYIIA